MGKKAKWRRFKGPRPVLSNRQDDPHSPLPDNYFGEKIRKAG